MNEIFNYMSHDILLKSCIRLFIVNHEWKSQMDVSRCNNKSSDAEHVYCFCHVVNTILFISDQIFWEILISCDILL